jgi:hypothetical protein
MANSMNLVILIFYEEKYEPKGKRNLGRPLKRWKDSVL